METIFRNTPGNNEIGNGDIGYICDGQLAAMGVEAAKKRGLHPVVFGTSSTASAAQSILCNGGTSIISDIGKDNNAKYLNQQSLDAFVDALKSGAPVAFDWENAPAGALKYLESKGLLMKPGVSVLETTQHRGREKEAINRIHGKTVTANYQEVNSLEDAIKAFRELGAGRLKTSMGGYDGKGQFVITSELKLEEAFKKLEEESKKKGESFPELEYEQNVNFAKEISVIIGRNSQGDFGWYDPFLNHHEGGIIRTTTVGDIGVDQDIKNAMIEFTKKTAEGLGVEGIMCMEMFLKRDATFRANEIAARAHNSGHITRSTHDISQFDLQIMGMLDEEMPGYVPAQRNGKMINIIGRDVYKYTDLDFFTWGNTTYPGKESRGEGLRTFTSYGKGEPKSERKMGHLEITKE